MTTRMRRTDRREQLLDTAAELLTTSGRSSITMERVAEQAGVSKATPYLHFANADAVVVEVYRREVLHMGERIADAVSRAQSPRDRVRVAVHTYFDVVLERGSILAVLVAPGSDIPARADDGARLGDRFVAELLTDSFGTAPRRAAVVAAMILGALNGAVDAWIRQVASRKEIEAVLVELVVHAASHE